MRICKIIDRYQDYVSCQNWWSGLLLNSSCNMSIVTILIILGNLHTKVVTPQKPPCCLSKMRSISHYHGASLLHWSYWICQLRSTQLTTRLFLYCLKSWFGVSGTALKWFTSYLSHRFQAIKIGSTLSDLHELLFGVPQGSVLGPLLLSLYTTPLSKVIGTHPDIKYHFYADDTQLFIHISHKNAALAFNKLKSCLLDVQKWMSSSMLKLNPDKTEFIIFGSHAQLKKLDPYLPVKIFGNFMHPAVVVKNLGVWFDANFSFANHVRNICKTCFIQIRDLRRVRKHLTDEAAILAANALVSSRLDYCNSLFRSLSSLNMRKLQCIQNTLARIVTNCNKYTIGHLLFSNDSIGSQLNLAVSSKLPL